MIGGMSLQQLALPPIMDTSTADMAEEFYVPALSVSVRYSQGRAFLVPGGCVATNPYYNKTPYVTVS